MPVVGSGSRNGQRVFYLDMDMALTRPEIMEHIGEMLDHAFDNLVPVGQAEHWSRRLVRYGKDYRSNGTFGTQADRTEAMLTVKRKLFAKLTGLDPDTNAHTMDSHWIPSAEEDDN